MRYAAHKLTWPQVHAHGATLRAITELAITISTWTSEVAELAHRHNRHATQPHYARAAQHAKTSALAWHNVAHHLGALHTLGFDGRHAHEHAARLRRQIDTGPRAAATPADRLAALPTVRHAVLLLPELAGASNIAIRHLAADGLLRAATVTGTWVKLPNRVDALTNAYRDAATAARHLADACTALPGPQPTPGRAQHLANPDRPVLPAPAAPVQPPRETKPGHQKETISLQDPHHGLVTETPRRIRIVDPIG
jgi:hypothetical protein